MMSSSSILLYLFCLSLLTIRLGVCNEIECIPSERDTLLKLKTHLFDPSNRLSSWNLTLNSNCCQWAGVVCNNYTSHVAELHLNASPPTLDNSQPDVEAYIKAYERSMFAGEINPCLVDLKHLNYLDFSGNFLLGSGMPIPSFLGRMTSLTHLNLSYAGFMGKIPPQIGNLSNLMYLDLSSNSFSSSIPHCLYGLHHLKFLNLRQNNLNGTISEALGNLTSLLQLDLSENQLEGTIPTTLGYLTSLVELDLSYNQLEGTIPTSFGNLTFLVQLDLSFNHFVGKLPTSLSILCNLMEIYFSGLKLNQQVSEILEILAPCISHGLTYLSVSSTQLSGNLTDQFGDFNNITYLDFSNNSIGGTLPRSFGKLSSLTHLDLSNNRFNGNPFESIRSLSQLSYFYISHNHFQAVVKEDDLANLTSMMAFYASGNNFTLKVSPNWLPSFQLTYLDMTAWQLGPNFPSWIQFQNNLDYLEMSNTRISVSIPTWFWEEFPHASYLNLSHNHINGELFKSLSNSISWGFIDLSSNQLHGKLPHLFDGVIWLDLSSNYFSESMTDFLCNKQFKRFELQFLNLASNNLSGKIPDCWMKWPNLVDVNIQSNHFVGNLPPSMGSLAQLQSLNIRNNSLSGMFPTVLRKNTQLISLDLGENYLSGAIPTWVGKSFLYMRILRLRSNNLSGHIPNEICDMRFLQDLDLAQNSLSGHIPNCFNHFNAMLLKNKSTDLFIYSHASAIGTSGTISILLWLKGRAVEYNSILGLVTNIDLSGNNLSGGIPQEITDLDGLIYLNLSNNQLSGQIPSSIGNMRSLESIDISRNQLSGEIPSTITNLSFLNKLEVSYNHLKGKIPTGTQMQSFEASNFVGNNLCGPPLPINCSSSQQIPRNGHIGMENDGHGMNWLFVSMALGFIVGFWAVVAPLFIYRSWRYAYFCFLEDMWYKLQSYW